MPRTDFHGDTIGPPHADAHADFSTQIPPVVIAPIEIVKFTNNHIDGPAVPHLDLHLDISPRAHGDFTYQATGSGNHGDLGPVNHYDAHSQQHIDTHADSPDISHVDFTSGRYAVGGEGILTHGDGI